MAHHSNVTTSTLQGFDVHFLLIVLVLWSDMEQEQWVFFFLMCASVAAAFLAYSISYRKEKKLHWRHPRVIIEFGLMLAFLIAAIFIKQY